MTAEREIADQYAERVAAEGAVLFFVDLLEQRALVKLDGFFQVGLQLFLRHIEQAQFQAGAGLGVLDQRMQAAP